MVFLAFSDCSPHKTGFDMSISTALPAAVPAHFPRQIAVLILVVVACSFAGNHVAARLAFENGTGLLLAILCRSGVALATGAGAMLAEAIDGLATRFDVINRLPTPGFPGGGAFRSPLLTLALTWYSLRDRL